VKRFGGEAVSAGSIIIRQRVPRSTRRQRRDREGSHPLALIDGVVQFARMGKMRKRVFRPLRLVGAFPFMHFIDEATITVRSGTVVGAASVFAGKSSFPRRPDGGDGGNGGASSSK